MKTIKTKGTKRIVSSNLSAEEVIARLKELSATSPGDNAKYFRDEIKGNKFLNLKMSVIFSVAKQFIQLPLSEIKKLLNSDYYEIRMAAVSVMDLQARAKKITEEEKKALYTLYIQNHDKINNWDLVDRSAPYVVGGYLVDKSHAPLYKLAKSKNACERRTAIVSTYYFIRMNECSETFKIAEMLIHDKHDLINKAVGSWIREAGKRDQKTLIQFLEKYAATMPRVTLRYSIENLDKKLKTKFMSAKD